MPDLPSQMPRALAQRARTLRLAGRVPALLAHPDWRTPSPVVLWLHGRTVHKELDPGRYLRWIRAGIAACAIDLPGHGERADPPMHDPVHTLDVLDRVIPEIDLVLESLADPAFGDVFDLDRAGLGGMSAGGMATLRRLCDPHPFLCAAVEATTGDLAGLYQRSDDRAWPVEHPPQRIAALDPLRHLDHFRPVPLLALHSATDRVVPLPTMTRFVDALRARYAALGQDPASIELVTWPETGAPDEHSGFGRFASEAKDLQTAFLQKHLGATPPPDPGAEQRV